MLRFRRWDHAGWDVSMVDDVITDTSQKGSANFTKPPGTNDDRTCIILFSHSHDGFSRRAICSLKVQDMVDLKDESARLSTFHRFRILDPIHTFPFQLLFTVLLFKYILFNKKLESGPGSLSQIFSIFNPQNCLKKRNKIYIFPCNSNLFNWWCKCKKIFRIPPCFFWRRKIVRLDYKVQHYPR